MHYIFYGNLPNIPKLETVTVPPWYSWGARRPSLALLASSFILFDISSMPRESALNMIGVINPVGVATATLTSTLENL